MYIISAISRVTSQQSYYSGLVSHVTYSQISIENEWDIERQFATRFKTYELAEKIADKWRKENTLVDFLVLPETE